MSETKVFVFSGASGAGKSTVLKRIMSERDDLRFSVSATTRAPREGEVDGVHYFFVTRERFQEMIAGGELLEYDEHFGNLYGTPVSQVSCGGRVVLDVEPNGAFNARKANPDAKLIFITPPSMEELERRLRSRGDTPEDQIDSRLERAKWEIAQSVHYDYVVINDDLDHCVKQVADILDYEINR
ncbi:MAG: guanylate kinase [Oscillospiraceae bacterium]|nr:guanylate kinase [Oscillospiraceae bacterium]